MRHQHQREQQRRCQCADIIEGQHFGDKIAEFELVLQEPHQQRHFEPDKSADDQDDAIKRQAEIGDAIEKQEQQRRRKAADDRDEDFDADEHREFVALHPARQPGPHAHGEQIAADDGGKLGDAVAKQIARQRAGEEFVDKAAGRDDKGRKQQDRADTGNRVGAGRISHEWRCR